MKYFIFILISCQMLFAQKKESKSVSDNGYKLDKLDYSYGDFMKFHSDSMNLDFPLMVFLPESYANSNKKFPVVYALHGYNNSELTEIGIRKMYSPGYGFKEAANDYQCVIVCPLVGNKFYINSPIDKKQKYASLIAYELVNFVESKYNVEKDRNSRILMGFSMGGYGAVSLLCRYPEIFSVALSRGGALEQKSLIEDLNWDDASIEPLGKYWQNQELYHLHGISNLINKIRDRKDLAIVLEIGREDFLYKANKRVEAKLNTTSIPYIFAEYPVGHVWSIEALNSLLTHLQYFRKTK